MDDISISNRFGSPIRPRSRTYNNDDSWDSYGSPGRLGSPTRMSSPTRLSSPNRTSSPTRLGSPARSSSPTRSSTPSREWDRPIDVSHPSPVEVVHKTEMLRIHGMLQQTQEELERTNREVAGVERSRKITQLVKDKNYQEEIERLRDTIDDFQNQTGRLEVRLDDAIRAKEEVNLRLEKANNLLRQTEEQLEARIAMGRNKAQQVADLTIRVHDLAMEKDAIANTSSTEIKEKIDQVVSREHAISLQESRIKSQQETIKRLKDDNDFLRKRLEESERKNREIDHDLNTTKGELKFHQSAYTKDLVISRKLEQLKTDNARLMNLLTKSREYSNFVEYVEEGRGVAYLPPRGSDFQEDQFGKAPHTYSFRNDREVEASSEWKNWVPEDAIAVVNDFKNKHLPHVPVGLFSEVMTRLNQIWRRRERGKLVALRHKYEDEIQGLRRQLSHRAPYDEVIFNSKIDHLKRELKRERDSPSKKDGLSPVMLDSTLSTVEHLAKQLTDLQSENGRLALIAGDADRTKDALFMEGAAWLGRKVVDIADRMGDKIGQLVTAFQVKARHAALVPTSSLSMSQSALEQMDDLELWESYPSDSSKLERLPQHLAEARLVRLQEVFLRYLERHIISFREKLRRLFEKVLETCVETEGNSLDFSY